MFEKYDVENLYYVEVVETFPYMYETINGKTTYLGSEIRRYKTIAYATQFRYIDIFNPNRIINCIMYNEDDYKMEIDKNRHLYTIIPESVERVMDDEKVKKNKYKTLTRMPFKNSMFSK